MMRMTDPLTTVELPEGGALCAVSGGLDSLSLIHISSCKKLSLLQMISPVSGRNTSVGRGELMRVDLLAVSTLPVTESMYCKTPCRRF